jgi:hypothetical protein
MRHATCVGGAVRPHAWGQIEASLAPLFARKPGKSRVVVDSDLFGESVQLAGVIDAAGRRAFPPG